jgi:hypothetical protein
MAMSPFEKKVVKRMRQFLENKDWTIDIALSTPSEKRKTTMELLKVFHMLYNPSKDCIEKEGMEKALCFLEKQGWYFDDETSADQLFNACIYALNKKIQPLLTTGQLLYYIHQHQVQSVEVQEPIFEEQSQTLEYPLKRTQKGQYLYTVNVTQLSDNESISSILDTPYCKYYLTYKEALKAALTSISEHISKTKNILDYLNNTKKSLEKDLTS